MLFKLTQKSGNTKTGSVATVTASRETCPKDCPHMGECYPNRGRLRYWWDRMAKGDWGYDWEAFVAAYLLLPLFTFVRYGQAGDLPSDEPGSSIVSVPMVTKWIKAIKARKSKGWLYSHKKDPVNIPVFRELSKAGMTVNVSCETMEEVKFWHSQGLHTVLTTEKINPGKQQWREGELVVKRCPNQLNKSFQCDHCMLCHDRDPNHVVLFRANKGTKVNT